ncbi:hypothetical protein [Thalassomonas haliotis]|uniref:Uncharacterized protein n=1 Tax=Thalassomonas haliotis TaxID=485448 RepID=A0ABY7VBY7_9GAMM|nr:hypothetical protein [Thalassomonas haliotis]WDE11053.1 hypothetical protein H3N35_22895 [Thalassomonas haliotis]
MMFYPGVFVITRIGKHDSRELNSHHISLYKNNQNPEDLQLAKVILEQLGGCNKLPQCSLRYYPLLGCYAPPAILPEKQFRWRRFYIEKFVILSKLKPHLKTLDVSIQGVF